MANFYDPARGFAFVVPDASGREVIVPASVLLRSGLADLLQGQRVLVRADSMPRGLQATAIEPLRIMSALPGTAPPYAPRTVEDRKPVSSPKIFFSTGPIPKRYRGADLDPEPSHSHLSACCSL